MKTVRTGIIGVGVMGGMYTGMLSRGEVPGLELTAVCDIDPAKLATARETAGGDLACYEDSETFFKEAPVDAVIITTPHYFHPPLAIQGFAHGLHVLSDKPAGAYTRQVREMNAAAAQSDKVFGIMFQSRTSAAFRKIKDFVDSGELGTLRRSHVLVTQWFRSQAYYNSGGWRATWGGEGGGVLLNQCPHNLDIWQWICGMPKRVRAFCAFGKYHDIEVEDAVTAYVEYENGATGVFVTTTGEAPGSNRFEVAGDRGKLVLEDGKLVFQRNRVPADEFCRTTTTMFGAPESWRIELDAQGGGGHADVLSAWSAAIREGKPLVAEGAEGLNSLMLINAMLLSTWTDDWVDLPLDDDLYYELLQKRVANSRFVKQTAPVSSVDFNASF